MRRGSNKVGLNREQHRIVFRDAPQDLLVGEFSSIVAVSTPLKTDLKNHRAQNKFT
jgi:hypothetical protein